ncbi:alanyl-tRNA editing protein Aarsd1-B-like [Teleopsis dalmanni]|uniref:alanyl-tRNA editing protein Aarsd1-B-like n=1 Tax=Teleopsis dalmanni TaxID=139649 RepID=UPI000D329F02|nr:alanyl-tRNA editing protein Aarsd1-B-like [Teleopsis dalmanni]
MVFKCQEDSFLKEFDTTVLSCEKATLDLPLSNDANVKRLEGYNVVCEDTILFPEGGGQPCDYGTINGQPVRNVVRKGSEAIHFVEMKNPFEEGTAVTQIVDWNRRLDHMQQHSGQHLITALFESEFKYDTTSWWLGSDTSYIELSTRHLVSQESLDIIERKANELIREGRNVTVLLVDPDDPVKFTDTRAPRGLPRNHVGLARLVRIEGVESNMCCGTHVTNLSQLQGVKLLYAETVKGLVYVHFAVGERVMRKLGECVRRERQMNLALKGGPAQHLDLVEKLQKNIQSTTKSLQKILKDLAISEAEKLETLKPRPQFYCLHRRDGIEPDFINTFLNNAPKDIFYFLIVSENVPCGGKGHMVLRGDPAVIQKFGAMFLSILEGKGYGKHNHFQGKVNVSKVPECVALLEEHFNSIKSIAEAS